MTHNPKPTDAQMKLARECAAKYLTSRISKENDPDVLARVEKITADILSGKASADIVEIALLAIQATEARIASKIDSLFAAEQKACG